MRSWVRVPLGGRIFSNLNLYITLLVPVPKGCSSPSLPRKHTHSLAQWLERQTSIHEVVGSSPIRRSNFSNLNIYITLLVPVPKGCSPIPSQKNTTHTHMHTHTRTHTHTEGHSNSLTMLQYSWRFPIIT